MCVSLKGGCVDASYFRSWVVFAFLFCLLSIIAGCSKHAGTGKNYKIDIIWKAPLREDDREQQTRVVEGFISQGVDGIVLAPFDRHALVRPVEEAAAAGIPTVIVDSALDTTK